MNAGHALDGPDRATLDQGLDDGDLLLSLEHVGHVLLVTRKVRSATTFRTRKVCYPLGVAAKKMGRPPKPKGEVKDVTLTIRMTAAERRKLEAAAKREGVSAGEWARLALARVT